MEYLHAFTLPRRNMATWQCAHSRIPQNSKDSLPKANYMIKYPDFFAVQFFNLWSVFDIYFIDISRYILHT